MLLGRFLNKPSILSSLLHFKKSSVSLFARPKMMAAASNCGEHMSNTKKYHVLLAFDAFNSMSQRIYLECLKDGYDVSRYEFQSPQGMIELVEQLRPDAIMCPFLTKRIPPEIYENKAVPCLIVHPGIEGDRGPSSIDWALREDAAEWGVTILQAEEVMDSGDIYDSNNFTTKRSFGSQPTKSSLYRFECINAAVKGAKTALAMIKSRAKPRPLDYSNPLVHGQLRPLMKQADRQIDWSLPAAKVCSLLRASDSQPGTLDTINGEKYFLYGGHIGEEIFESYAEPKTLLGKRNGAVFIKCGSGAVYVTHLKKSGLKEAVKLPATSVLPQNIVDSLPIVAEPQLQVDFLTTPKTFQEIFTWQRNGVCYLWFDFYNGAMNTEHCQRLELVVRHLAECNHFNVLALMGGLNFFSNGINLNTIEACGDKAAYESWRNINAIDDFVKSVLVCHNKVTISAFYGNAGAGGVMAALAADYVFAHGGVVLNPSYRKMGLFGSEYWTYSLPKRVGEKKAQQLTDSVEPISAEDALRIGMIDKILAPSADNFVQAVINEAETLAANTAEVERLLVRKKAERSSTPAFEELIAEHRRQELAAMVKCFESQAYNAARKAFVYKNRAYLCCSSAEP